MEQVGGGLPQLGGGLEELVTEVEHRPVPALRRLVVVRPQLVQLPLHEPEPQPLRGGGEGDPPDQGPPGDEGRRQGAVQVEMELHLNIHIVTYIRP